jgi:hypothetical protein
MLQELEGDFVEENFFLELFFVTIRELLSDLIFNASN